MSGEPKSVLILGPTPPPYHGVAVFVRDIVEAKTKNKSWIVEHLDTSDRRDAENLGRWDAGNLSLGFSNLADLAARLLRRRHALVYVPISQNIPAFLRDALFILQSRLLGARVIVHLHGGYFRTFYDAAPGWFKGLARFTLRRAGAVAVLGEEFRPIFEGLVDASRIHVVENGVVDLFASEPVANSGDGNTVLYLGTLNRTKGILELLKAMALLKGELPEMRLRVAGAWSEPDAKVEAEALIAREDLGGRVAFVGNVDGEAKRAFLKSGGVFCLPTHYPYEGQPLVLLEAMSAGLAVLSTRHGAIGSTVEHGVTGQLIPANSSAKELAETLRAMLGKPEELARFGAAGRTRFLTRYTLEACHSRLFAVFTEAAK